MEGSRRLLNCLQYPLAAEINFTSKADVLILVCWLEDRKIREMEIEEREVLRKDGEHWDGAFTEYLQKLGCPFRWTALGDAETSADCLAWFIAHSVSAEYEDAAESCVNIEDDAVFVGTNNSGNVMDIDDISVNVSGEAGSEDPALRQAIDEMGTLLALARSQDEGSISYLKRAARQARLFLTEGSLQSLQNKGSQGTALVAFPSVFECADPLIKQLAVVLRMLYLSDFRELQNDLNSLIVLGQEYTANPKTNSALGVVGR
jgi:hypothetical protein